MSEIPLEQQLALYQSKIVETLGSIDPTQEALPDPQFFLFLYLFFGEQYPGAEIDDIRVMENSPEGQVKLNEIKTRNLAYIQALFNSITSE